jgi:hypothetical protein
MSRVTVYHSRLEQSIFDVALMAYGTLDGGLHLLLADNPDLVQSGGVVAMFGSSYRLRRDEVPEPRIREEMQRVVPVTEGGYADLGVWVSPAYAPWVTPQAQVYVTPAYTGTASGVRPDQFSEETAPSDANFEVYSQKGGVTRKARLSAVGPGIDAVQYIPQATGNTANRNQVVTDPDGAVWFIAGNGAAVKLSGSGDVWVREAMWHTGVTVTSVNQIPANTALDMMVFRSGVKVSEGAGYSVVNPYAFSLAYAADQEYIEIFIKK